MQISTLYGVAVMAKALFRVLQGIPKVHKSFPALKEFNLSFHETSTKEW